MDCKRRRVDARHALHSRRDDGSIRLTNLDDCEFCSMRWIEVDPYIVDRARRVIAEVYDTKSKEKEETRTFQGLDHSAAASILMTLV